MTASNPKDPNRFRLLATYIAGRSVDVAEASAGEAAHTDGKVIFVSAGRPARRAAPRDADPERPAGRGESGSAIGEGVTGTSLDRAPLPRARRSPRACRTRRTDPTRRRASPRRRTAHRDRRRVTRDGQEPQRKSPTHPTGSGLSDPPDCWRLRPDRARRPPTKSCVCSSIPSTCPRLTTTATRSRPGRARSSNCLRVRSLTHALCRTFSARCSAAHAPPVTALPAQRCRFARSGGRTRSDRTPVLLPTQDPFHR